MLELLGYPFFFLCQIVVKKIKFGFRVWTVMFFDHTTSIRVKSSRLPFIDIFFIHFNFINFLLIRIKHHILSIFFRRKNVNVFWGNTHSSPTKMVKAANIIYNFWDIL